MPVRNLICSAYGVPAWRLSGGPAWLGSDGYDIIGTLPPNMGILPADTKEEQLRLMMQALLADRFKLAIRRERRDCSVYELVPAKGGPKLVASADGKFRFGAPIKRRGHLEMPGASMAMFIDYLNSMPAVGRPVLNKTDLKGPYDITLDWAPDSIDAKVGDSGPSIFTAFQEQLGLKLEPGKSSFEFIAIDHVERPTKN
ncbi:MAG: TIGR03435 family protein [Bryobacteraceae bacterium]